MELIFNVYTEIPVTIGFLMQPFNVALVNIIHNFKNARLVTLLCNVIDRGQ